MNSHNKYIEEIALQALKKVDCKNPPVPVEKIANEFGLEVIEFPFHEKISGLLKKEEGIIGVNKGQPPVRRRFTVSHELGHFLLGHGMENAQEEMIEGSFDKPLPQEREANMFASILLMPSKWVREEVEKKGKIDIDELSQTFGVSKQAMTIRLLYLKLI
jgi:Zn-dependent peptidase ImmA (M78 family)